MAELRARRSVTRRLLLGHGEQSLEDVAGVRWGPVRGDRGVRICPALVLSLRSGGQCACGRVATAAIARDDWSLRGGGGRGIRVVGGEAEDVWGRSVGRPPGRGGRPSGSCRGAGDAAAKAQPAAMDGRDRCGGERDGRGERDRQPRDAVAGRRRDRRRRSARARRRSSSSAPALAPRSSAGCRAE